MNLKNLLRINAFLFIGAGIAFALYAPLVLGMYGILGAEGDTLLYWYSTSFARMYGAALFGFGFLVWAVSNLPEIVQPGSAARRAVILAMILANSLGLFVAVTQQVSIWGSAAGWITTGVYLLLLCGYSILLAVRK